MSDSQRHEPTGDPATDPGAPTRHEPPPGEAIGDELLEAAREAIEGVDPDADTRPPDPVVEDTFARAQRALGGGGSDTYLEPESDVATRIEPSTGARASGSSLRSSVHERSARLEPGAVFAGKYELLREIARGGMGAVYEARQIDLNRVVALKVMLSGAGASADERARFRREAESAANLQHPHIVPVFDIDEVEGNLYFTQEFVAGQPLSKRKATLEPTQLRDVMIAVCDAVAFAHARGIIHRDLKPDNIMLDANDQPKIMDFGLAKQIELVDAEGQPSLVTRDGAIMGTPHYMPPEQAEGLVGEVDAQSDVYALGVILYELFTGQLPFQARRLTELFLKIFEQDPVPPRQLDATIDPDVEAIILKALEKRKERRYASAAALRDDLLRQRDGQTITARRATFTYRLGKWARRRRRALAAAAVVAAALAGSGGVAWSSHLEAEAARTRQLEERLDQALADGRARLAHAEARAATARTFLDDRARPASERAAQAPPLAQALAQERRALTAALGALAEFEARPEARELTRALEQVDRAGLAPLAARAQRLAEVHGLLASAPARRAAVERAAQAAIAATSSAATARDAPAAASETVAAALAPGERLLAKPATGAPRFGPAFAERAQAFRAALREARRDAFAALKLAESGAPEQTRAQAHLTALDAIGARFDAARSGALELRTANATQAAATRLLQLLAARKATPAVRLQGARLAQRLVQRGLEADPRRRAFDALRREANAAYARALLDMGALPLVEGLLEQAGFDLAPKTRAALRRAYAAVLEGKQRVRARLDDAVEGLATRSLDALNRIATELAGLKPTATQYGLEALRVQRLGEVRRARLERAWRDVEEALAAAGQAERLPAREQLRQRDRLRTAWSEARSLIEARRAYLTKAVARVRLATCDLGLAALDLNAALGAEADDPRRAHALVGQALALARPLAERAGPARERASGLTRQARALAARLSATLAARARRAQAPPGMVWIEGTGERAVPLGDAGDPHNPPRKVKVAAFYLSIHEVTNADYQAFVDSERFTRDAFWRALGVDRATVRAPRGWSNGRFPKGEGGLPVTGITFAEARGYAAFRGRRLPTDDEWELVARYAKGDEPPSQRRRYPWRDAEWSPDRLRRAPRAPGDNPHDVTPHGLLDLTGNVSEWVAHGQAAAARGASFLYPFERLARGAHRFRPPANYHGPQLGLRLAKDAQ